MHGTLKKERVPGPVWGCAASPNRTWHLFSLSFEFVPELRAVSVIVFVVGWIGQFYGHKVEGKKPSFFKDVAFLLIGPLWVLQKFAPGLFRQ
ncbi:MAG: DUF962 domain-containing protein [Bdellovibrionaceae bacterium]|nr:DUF962 domain-containing protein [Pseudobdellovibrionaceae bacterium]MBX3032970.1 DUF962 domain-containing protein [Pseudobdellovibrionaceae bacterium]